MNFVIFFKSNFIHPTDLFQMKPLDKIRFLNNNNVNYRIYCVSIPYGDDDTILYLDDFVSDYNNEEIDSGIWWCIGFVADTIEDVVKAMGEKDMPVHVCPYCGGNRIKTIIYDSEKRDGRYICEDCDTEFHITQKKE